MQQQADPVREGNTIMRGDRETPFKSNNALTVTHEQAEGIHAFLRELKPGVYIKCSKCKRMKFNEGSLHWDGLHGLVICGACADA